MLLLSGWSAVTTNTRVGWRGFGSREYREEELSRLVWGSIELCVVNKLPLNKLNDMHTLVVCVD